VTSVTKGRQKHLQFVETSLDSYGAALCDGTIGKLWYHWKAMEQHSVMVPLESYGAALCYGTIGYRI
jgi:hypothetical protein